MVVSSSLDGDSDPDDLVIIGLGAAQRSRRRLALVSESSDEDEDHVVMSSRLKKLKKRHRLLRPRKLKPSIINDEDKKSNNELQVHQ